MISWDYHDNENKLNSFSKSDFDLRFWYCNWSVYGVPWYCDVNKLSKPFTLSQIRANVVDFDIAIDNSMISWCCDIIMVVYQYYHKLLYDDLSWYYQKTLQESYERNIDISKMIVMIDNMIFCNKYETFYPSSLRFMVTILRVSLCGHNFSLTLITGKHCYHF